MTEAIGYYGTAPESGSVIRAYRHDGPSNWCWNVDVFSRQHVSWQQTKHVRHWVVAHQKTMRTVTSGLSRRLTFAEAADLAGRLDREIEGAGQVHINLDALPHERLVGWSPSLSDATRRVIQQFAADHGMTFTPAPKATADPPRSGAGGHLAGGGHKASSGPFLPETVT